MVIHPAACMAKNASSRTQIRGFFLSVSCSPSTNLQSNNRSEWCQFETPGCVIPLLKCPHPYLVRNVPFLCFCICFFLLCPVSGCGRSGTLRRALCGAFRV